MPEDLALQRLIAQHTPRPKRKKADDGLVPRLLKRAEKWPLVRLFRNQVGTYRLARPECDYCRQRGRYLSSGLALGSGDLIGYKVVVIDASMVGHTMAQFVSAEAKAAHGALEDRQVVWLERCRADGAIAVCVRTVEELESALR